ncbi:M50 family metallopeptidase [Pseudonocardia oroxyli]|uniref:Membrane-associated protease RseP, regulator of RpoE activity n=1 Tax=Pseudonocardia oroxyli TaxID=366584 RepID=A0A1G7KC77_PSEOR|nr:M50 family metallopeptidase [Pseudonocardia oroxyli]SDF34757.1 Membrane-associated protease RseP, regulator of RpoE activity [Pseudonocardia oroxyli]
MTVVWTIVGIVVFFLGILFSVAWHELGHFATAKWFGIKVPEFFVGFGKTVWSRRRGETEFGFKAVPLGGYVRMIGMLPPAKGELYGRSRRTGPFQGLIDDARQASAADVGPEDADRQFYTRAPWKRIIVMIAGPLMNLVLAIVLFAIVLMGFGTMTATSTVSSVSQCVLPAGSQTDVCPPGAPLTPAAAAGFEPGDRIVSFDGQTFDSWEDTQKAIRAATGTVSVVVDRGGQLVTLTPTLITTELPALDGSNDTVQASFLGLSPLQEIQRQGIGAVGEHMVDIVGLVGQKLVEMPQRVPNLFGAVFLGEQRDQDSPVGVVGASRIGGEILAGDAPPAQEVAAFLSLLAMVNISLFLFNLLPIPPLDGGQIFPAIWEAIRRRIAALRGRPDPGPVDAAKLMPVAMTVALIFIGWSALVFVADVINPVRLG